MQRPTFNPQLASQWGALDPSFIPLISCPSEFPVDLFEESIHQLVHHPEYNSTLILRSDVISDSDDDEAIKNTSPLILNIEGFRLVRVIRRKLLARRPERDDPIEQLCAFYSSSHQDIVDNLILTPITNEVQGLPYYHPAVSHIAFRCLPTELRIEVVPLPNQALDPNSRIYRTCLSLLETLHRYFWGSQTSYQKRVKHDQLVPRNEYQDLYLVMRAKYKSLVGGWKEVTDPLKHVFEDIGIATFLILLWKDTFKDSGGRPPGGFLDFGCGNGLLTHILVSEGHAGHGIDMRQRNSWKHYPESTQERLHLHTFNPKEELPEYVSRKGTWVIGNHADELTPWVPIVSNQIDASGWLNIPCCAWSFAGKWQRRTQPYLRDDDFVRELNLGDESGWGSSYSQYRIWVASLSACCGWEVECEMLRIPSTRNWAAVGRKRRGDIIDVEDLLAAA